MIPKAVQDEGQIGIAGCQLRVPIPVHEDQEVTGTIEEPQGHARLLGVMAIEGQVDVGSHGAGMVHTHHPLHDQGGLVLVAKSQGGVSKNVTDLGHGPASGEVMVTVMEVIVVA